MPVSIRGMAVHCALGADRAACVRALRNPGKPALETLPLPGAAEPPSASFYSLHGTNDPLAPGRMQSCLPAIVEAALNDAALDARARRRLPVFVGSSCFNVRDSELANAKAYAADASTALPMPHAELGHLAQEVCRVAGSHGPDFSFNSACSSAANALLAATRYLRAGLAQHALVVGVELANLASLAGFSALQLLAEQVQPFAAGRRGVVLGEGMGAVVLEAHAPSRFRLVGGCSRVDTHSVTTAAPDGSSVAIAMTDAMQDAGLAATDIRALKAHATGTPANDEAEARGLHRVFPTLPPVCVLKPWTGHTLGACGIVELVLFAGALEQGFIPGAPAHTPDPDLAITPLAAPVPAMPGHYLLNQFGFGGNNAVLALEMTC